MRGVLAVNDSTVWELSLHCFTQNWIERFVLVTTHIHATNHEGNTQFESLEMISSLTRFFQEFWSKTKQITNTLY